jgi:hypothetical protein
VRGAHHNAFEYGLPADESFLAAFERWQELDCDQKTPQCPKKLHKYWINLRREMFQK